MNVLRKKKVYAPRRECAESQYKQLYRFEEGNVEWMADYFLEHSWERRGGALTARKQLQVLLRYVSDPGFQVGARVRVYVRALKALLLKTIRMCSQLSICFHLH